MFKVPKGPIQIGLAPSRPQFIVFEEPITISGRRGFKAFGLPGTELEVLTGKEIISGGQFLGASGAAGVVNSGTSSFVATDIEVYLTAGSGNFVGVALTDAASQNVPLTHAQQMKFLQLMLFHHSDPYMILNL